jgi:hypothetical protein
LTTEQKNAQIASRFAHRGQAKQANIGQKRELLTTETVFERETPAEGESHESKNNATFSRSVLRYDRSRDKRVR